MAVMARSDRRRSRRRRARGKRRQTAWGFSHPVRAVRTGTMAAVRARVVVVGKGMIGSAAARHLAGLTDGVVLVGPDEPAERAAHDDVFGSHYDEGRIYRVLD